MNKAIEYNQPSQWGNPRVPVGVIEYENITNTVSKPRRFKGQSKAHFNRTQVANSQIMFAESYTEYDEPDIYDKLEAVSLDEDTMGAECELLALVEFGALPFEYLEDY